MKRILNKCTWFKCSLHYGNVHT